jgi:hypothetical protein
MNMLHLVIVFLHVASAMGIFVALGIEALMLVQLRGARTGGEARGLIALSRYVQRVGMTSMIAVLVTGLYLATAYWRWQGAWMGFGFLTLIAVAVVGAMMTGRRLARLQRDATHAIDVWTLWRGLATSFTLRLALLAGVVCLMTIKPAAPFAAALVIIVAAAAGLAIARLGLPRAPRRTNEQLGRAT